MRDRLVGRLWADRVPHDGVGDAYAATPNSAPPTMASSVIGSRAPSQDGSRPCLAPPNAL